jgi:negative regulator of flagellin synthesis FlgM
MKIDNGTKSISSSPTRDEPARSIKKAPDESGAPAHSAQVQLSPLSAQLISIQRGFADTPVVNAAKVAELTEAISSGHFKVDANKVAARLLETVHELIAASRRN